MNSEIVKVFDEKVKESYETSAAWIFIPGKEYKGVSVIETGDGKWVVNDDGEMFEGEFAEILKKCIEIKNRIK